MDRELLLLGLLRRSKMHGYELHEFINHNLGSCTELKKSTAYYLLEKMAAQGWISETREQKGNRPVRRVYTITEAGEAAFQYLLRLHLSSYKPGQFSGDTSLTFLDALPSQEAHTLLSLRRDSLVHDLESLRAVPRHQGSIQLVLDHHAHHLAAELAWLNQIIENLYASPITEE